MGYTTIDYTAMSESNSSSRSIGLLWWIPIFLSGYIINQTRNYLFPILFIATGKQVKEYNKRKTISYILFGVVFLGVIINIISELIINGT